MLSLSSYLRKQGFRCPRVGNGESLNPRGHKGVKLVRAINVKLRSLDFYLLGIVESMRVSIQGRAKQNISEDEHGQQFAVSGVRVTVEEENNRVNKGTTSGTLNLEK